MGRSYHWPSVSKVKVRHSAGTLPYLFGANISEGIVQPIELHSISGVSMSGPQLLFHRAHFRGPSSKVNFFNVFSSSPPIVRKVKVKGGGGVRVKKLCARNAAIKSAGVVLLRKSFSRPHCAAAECTYLSTQNCQQMQRLRQPVHPTVVQAGHQKRSARLLQKKVEGEVLPLPRSRFQWW